MDDRWRSRIEGHGTEDPEQLLANPRNWRIHPGEQQEALKSLLGRVGWVQNVIVNKRTGHVVDGHLRVGVAISEGQREIPVVYVDLDEDEEQAVLAMLDPLAAMAATDSGALVGLLADLDTDSVLANLVAQVHTLNEDESEGATASDIAKQAEKLKTQYDEQGADDPAQRMICPSCGHEFHVGGMNVPKSDDSDAEKPALDDSAPPVTADGSAV